MIILNDLHLGVNRVAGTTPQSAANLKTYMFNQFGRLLNAANEDLVILGDLFDGYSVSNADLLLAYQNLQEWLTRGHKLTMVQGNHDCSNDSSKLSSFHLLCELLDIESVQGFRTLPDGTQIISHVLNQDLFDATLSRVQPGKYLLLHCNYDNHFAVNSDHSLNITKAQVEALPVEFVVFAHEHHARTALDGKVFVAGNQFPSSIADCLGGDKAYTRLTDVGPVRVPFWAAAESYVEMPWDAQVLTTAEFVRLSGRCEPERAAEMSNMVAQYRRGSGAYIVSNAVEIGTREEFEAQAAESLVAAQSFDVMGALKEFLTVEEFKVLETLE